MCIINRLPLFIVGKPGTSKTLTMQVITSNMQGQQSPRPFFRNFPAVHIFSYQCSPLSTSDAIQRQYDMALRYQNHAAHGQASVLLLDEVGLAEHSPSMPLKVLHSLLVRPAVAIIGLSEWLINPTLGKLSDSVGRKPFAMLAPFVNVFVKMHVALRPSVWALGLEQVVGDGRVPKVAGTRGKC